MAYLDPREADLSGLEQLERERATEGFRLVPLRELRGRSAELYALDAATMRDIPADQPAAHVGYDEWVVELLRDPDLDDDGSFVVLHGDRPVSFAWLRADRESGRALNEMTGTLAEYRGRGLARLVKLATVRWAAENGITEILTANDRENSPMLALNRSLGYRPLVTETTYAREL